MLVCRCCGETACLHEHVLSLSRSCKRQCWTRQQRHAAEHNFLLAMLQCAATRLPLLVTNVSHIWVLQGQRNFNQSATSSAATPLRTHLFATQRVGLCDRVGPQGLCQGLVGQQPRQRLHTLEALLLDGIGQLITAHELAACEAHSSSTNTTCQCCLLQRAAAPILEAETYLLPTHHCFTKHPRYCRTCCCLVDPAEHDLALVCCPEHHGRID